MCPTDHLSPPCGERVKQIILIKENGQLSVSLLSLQTGWLIVFHISPVPGLLYFNLCLISMYILY